MITEIHALNGLKVKQNNVLFYSLRLKESYCFNAFKNISFSLI
jgi:hypothetical protein